MLWLTLAAIAVVPVAARVWSLRATTTAPTVWWWANTIALVAIAAGSGFLVAEPAVNHALAVPNVAYVLSNLSFTVAAGSVQIYCHCLRADRPSLRWMTVHAATAAGVAAVIIFGWVIAPVHDLDYGRFRQAPVTAESVLYDVTFHVYLGLVVLNVAICAYTQVGTSDTDPGRRIGGLIIAAATGIDVVAHVCYLARLALQPVIGPAALTFATIADGLTVLCVLGVASGMAMFPIVPRVRHLTRTWRLAAQLRPVWLRVRDLNPSVALPGERVTTTRLGTETERMLIELSDAMRNLPVRHRSDLDDPIETVAAALVAPPDDPDCIAGDILPASATRHDEEVTALAIARSYARLETRTSHAS